MTASINLESGQAIRATIPTVLFTETFESPVVSGFDPTPPEVPNWVGATTGFGAARMGLDEVSSTNWTSPSGSNTQVYNCRYTNSGITTREGVIGSLDVNNVTYTVSFDVQFDKRLTGSWGADPSNQYNMQLYAADNIADVDRVNHTGNIVGATLLNDYTNADGGVVPDDDQFHTFRFSYTTDPVTDASLDGQDICVRFKGATSSAVIDNVRVAKNSESTYKAIGIPTYKLIWTPAQIQTLTWFDAGDISTIDLDGSNVTQWDDKSGNGHHATQSSATNQPTYSTSTRTMTFDGSDILGVGNNVGNLTDPYKDLQNFAVITVGSWGANSNNNNLFASWWGSGSGGGTTNGWNFRQRTGLSLTLRPGNDSGGSVDPPFGEDFIGAGIRDSSDDIFSRINGTQTYSKNNSSTISYTTRTNISAIGGLFGGDNWSSPNFYLRSGSTVKEIIVIDNTDVATVQLVEGYLAWKWKMVDGLDGSHPYKNSRPLL
jgi:hypothetical protein